MLSGVHFVDCLDPLEIRDDGSVVTQAFVSWGHPVPSWMDVRGLVPLNPSMFEERMMEVDGEDVMLVFPRT